MIGSRAQIIATIGPASKSEEIIKKMISNQMDVVRLNFAWGTYEEHEHYIKTVRRVAEEFGKKIPIVQDLAGPRITSEEGHGFDPSAREIITEKDLRDLDFGLEQKVDYITMSYVGSREDVKKIKEEILKRGASVPVIAKVERKVAVEKIDEIIKAAGAIMIGRGDLGNEIPLGQIPLIQRQIIESVKKAGKPVIVATQMLFSMVENPEPTRAEVTDVSQAILEGADAVMLSEETAIGKYPVRAVEVMESIVVEAEKQNNKADINLL